jgi:hypothetical protein
VDPDQDPVRSETFRKINPDQGSSGSEMNLKLKKVGSGSGKKSFRTHNTLIVQGNCVPVYLIVRRVSGCLRSISFSILRFMKPFNSCRHLSVCGFSA